jgi:hypothetical protein
VENVLHDTGNQKIVLSHYGSTVEIKRVQNSIDDTFSTIQYIAFWGIIFGVIP